MKIDEPLAIKVETENWQTHTRISPEQVRELVRRIGSQGDRYLVVQRIPDLPDVFIQTWHEHGKPYQLEHRASRELFFGTELADPERVADAIVGWARQEWGSPVVERSRELGGSWDAGITWEPIAVAPPEDVPELPDEVRERVEPRIRELLLCGYADRKVLSEVAEEYLVEGDERPVSPAQARQLVDRLWLKRVAEQQEWTGTTDPERLTLAFEALDAQGITARENFTCCRSCGMSETGAEREDARGFVFFHQQCTDSAPTAHELALYYGGFDGSDETTTAVGHEVVAALGAAGLSTEWDGSPDKAVFVKRLTWHKRLLG